jgi:hypothetical protein
MTTYHCVIRIKQKSSTTYIRKRISFLFIGPSVTTSIIQLYLSPKVWLRDDSNYNSLAAQAAGNFIEIAIQMWTSQPTLRLKKHAHKRAKEKRRRSIILCGVISPASGVSPSRRRAWRLIRSTCSEWQTRIRWNVKKRNAGNLIVCMMSTTLLTVDAS